MFIKAMTTDNKVKNRIEYYNIDNILTIIHYDDNVSKILMGAGLYYHVETSSMKIVDISDVIKNNN